MSISFTPTETFQIMHCLTGNYGGPQYDSSSILVQRALSRFVRELEAYRNGRSKLSEVRKYHRLLTEALHEHGGDPMFWLA